MSWVTLSLYATCRSPPTMELLHLCLVALLYFTLAIKWSHCPKCYKEMDYSSPKAVSVIADVLLPDQPTDWMVRGQENMKTVVSSLNWDLGSIIQLSTHESMDPLIMPQTALSAWLSAWKTMEREPCSKNGHAVFVSIFHSVPYMHSYNAVRSIHRCMHICLLCLRVFLPSDLHTVMLQGFWGS